jgi:phosphatidylglycerophosphate synthase
LRPTFVRPNAVTLAAGACMAMAAGLVAIGGRGLVVAACLAIALVLDTADGHLARLQGTASEFGRWLDEVLDEAADMALHAAIAWWAFVSRGEPLWLALGMAYGMGKYLFRVVSVSNVVDEGSPGGLVPPLGVRAVVRLIGHADVRWHLWIVLAAVGQLEVALIAYSFYFPARALLMAVGKVVRRG